MSNSRFEYEPLNEEALTAVGASISYLINKKSESQNIADV